MQNIKYRAPNAMPIISHKHPIPARSTMTRQRKKKQLRQRERKCPEIQAWLKQKMCSLNDQLLVQIVSDTDTH